MLGIGRTLVFFGAALVVLGLAFMLWARLGLPPRLPGDLVFRRGSVTVFVPVATSILLSILLTVLLNVLARRR